MSTPNNERRRKRLPFVGLAEGRKPVPFIPITVRAAAEETGGTFELYEVSIPTGKVREVVGKGPPPHVHREHEEAFYILEGEFTFNLGDDAAPAPKGTLVVVPRGTRHSFSGKEGSRALIFAIPGGLAGFFEELGAGLAAGHADADLRRALAGKYDSYPEVP
ncbi:MAG TPA: cupin domain-containing protein [Candidatus Limnocylindria bacterium]